MIDSLRRFLKRRIQPLLVAVAVVAMLGCLTMPGAWATPNSAGDPAEQTGTNTTAPPPVDDAPLPNSGSADAGDIPSETVSRFVEAYLAVVELIESKEASLQRAETDTESQQMQEEIQRQAIGLIQEHELTLQSYWELLGLANSDPEFRERVLAQVEEASL
jgi:hypothetical protein